MPANFVGSTAYKVSRPAAQQQYWSQSDQACQLCWQEFFCKDGGMVDAKASKAFVLVEHESSSLSPCIFNTCMLIKVYKSFGL